MAQSTGTLMVFVTFPTLRQGEKAAEAWVRLRLAACVNLIPGIRSVFFWKGKVEHTRECLLVVKTTMRRFEALRRVVIATHPYSVPEVVAIVVDRGHRPYLRWVRDSVQVSARSRRPK